MLSPATEGASADPATPVRSTTKRKAPTRKTADPSASPTPGAEESIRGKKKATLKVVSEETVERDDEGNEESPSKKLKADASEDQE
jgi:hypothetical protein